MRAPLLVAVLLLSACASPLANLARRAEQVQAYDMGWVPPNTSTMQDIQKRLRYAADRIGITIQEGGTSDNAYGTMYHDERLLTVREGLSLDAQVEVVAHELAHYLQPVNLNAREREIFADGVSYLVVRPHTDDVESYARYIAFYKSDVRNVLRVYEREMMAVAKFLRGEGGNEPPRFPR